MLITRAYKIRLYPNKAQRTFFNKSFGCCRVIYNEMLYLRILDNGTVRNTETGVNQDTPMPVENPTMDERSVMNLKSSDSVNQELLYKDFIPNGEGPVL